MTSRMQQVLPPGMDNPSSQDVLQELRQLTEQLIACYWQAGRLGADPFEDVRGRENHVQEAEVRDALKGCTVLVIGGAGCVGSVLSSALGRFQPRRIVCLDKAVTLPATLPAAVVHYRADIRDATTVEAVFATEWPHVVFHLAAQRDPGRSIYRRL